jgi:CDP-diacylglycerol--glycerol-3-phosphate 3-phosphatidyltransferase
LKERFRKLFTNVWNIPNALTMLRLVLIPVFVVVFFNTPRDQDKIAALVIFAVASITDMFDGMLARKLNQITDFGKLFDPLADKLMVVTSMVCQAIIGVFPWAAIAIVAAKELIMFFGGMFMLSKGVVVYSNYWGKTAQVFFIVSLLLSFFHPSLVKGNVCLFGITIDILLLWVTVALALAALIVYATGAIKTLKAQKAAPSDN